MIKEALSMTTRAIVEACRFPGLPKCCKPDHAHQSDVAFSAWAKILVPHTIKVCSRGTQTGHFRYRLTFTATKVYTTRDLSKFPFPSGPCFVSLHAYCLTCPEIGTGLNYKDRYNSNALSPSRRNLIPKLHYVFFYLRATTIRGYKLS